jgi:hypothetical protein
MVKNMCFLLRGHVQIQRGVGYVYLHRLYQSNRWAKGVSYTNLVSGLAVTLKIDYYYYYYYYGDELMVWFWCQTEKVEVGQN